MRHGQRRDFALRQRRDPAGGRDCRRTGRRGGPGRIASQTSNPVYPRQDSQGSAQRDRRQRTAATDPGIRLGQLLGINKTPAQPS